MAKKLITVFLFCMIGLAAGGASATVFNGMPSYDPSKAGDGGLYVWRTWDGQWRVRLVGGNSGHSFTGSIWATKPIWSVTRVSYEHDDILTRPSSQALRFTMNVVGKGVDGIDFTLPADAGICLWGSSTAGRPVFLGANRTPANTPVDLLGTGACNGDNSFKYKPGHYIALADWETQAHMIEAIRPGVQGIHRRYHWAELEPSFGNYDFSRLEADLKIAADHGVQLVAMIVDKTFNNVMPMPPYLRDQFTLRTASNGYIAKRWAPYVVRRMAALTFAMGQRFDAHPNFEGVAIQESAPSLSGRVLDASGYTPEKYRDALIETLLNTRRHFPRSQVFWYMNFLPRNQSYIADIASATAPHRIAMGGPDVLPDSAPLKTMTYPFYDQFKGRMTLFASMQYDSYAHLHTDKSKPTKYWTMPQLFWYARDRLHVNYVFWTRKTVAAPWDSYDWTHSLPVIRNNQVFNQ